MNFAGCPLPREDRVFDAIMTFFVFRVQLFA